MDLSRILLFVFVARSPIDLILIATVFYELKLSELLNNFAIEYI